MKKLLAAFILCLFFVFVFTPVAGADVRGIDVSRWQGQIDWDAAKDSFSFVIIKAGGSDNGFYTDRQFQRNRDEARRLGKPRGFYYYAGGGNPYEEATHFASIVGELQRGEVLALDFEIDHRDPAGYSWTFLRHTEQLLGVKPMLYTNMNRVWTIDWRGVVENGNPLWGAIYDENPYKEPRPGHWPQVAIKQFTDSGYVPGITANSVDVNYFKGEPADFESMGYQPPGTSDVAPSLPEQAQETRAEGHPLLTARSLITNEGSRLAVAGDTKSATIRDPLDGNREYGYAQQALDSHADAIEEIHTEAAGEHTSAENENKAKQPGWAPNEADARASEPRATMPAAGQIDIAWFKNPFDLGAQRREDNTPFDLKKPAGMISGAVYSLVDVFIPDGDSGSGVKAGESQHGAQHLRPED